MKLGITLPSYIYNDTRAQLADTAFRALAKTEPLEEQTTLLLLVKEGTQNRYDRYVEELRKPFNVILQTDAGLHGTEQTLAYGTSWLFDPTNAQCDYVTWMGDDADFHPKWLKELSALVSRHPDAKSWSVYRSAYEWIHRTLDESGQDVRVRSICGHCMTLSRKEWEEWAIDWRRGGWSGGGGDTLDLVHTEHRPGERWVTKRSYVNHTGKEGVHCTIDIPEYARDFVLD